MSKLLCSQVSSVILGRLLFSALIPVVVKINSAYGIRQTLLPIIKISAEKLASVGIIQHKRTVLQLLSQPVQLGME
jgi:hypothetical protein